MDAYVVTTLTKGYDQGQGRHRQTECSEQYVVVGDTLLKEGALYTRVSDKNTQDRIKSLLEHTASESVRLTATVERRTIEDKFENMTFESAENRLLLRNALEVAKYKHAQAL